MITNGNNGELEGLFRDGILVGLEIRYWSCRKAVHPQDLKLKPDEVPDFITLGRKLLVPREQWAKFRSIEMKARRLVDDYSFGFPIAGVKFVPREALATLIEELENLKAEFQETTTGFIRQYADLHRQMIERYPDHRRALEGYYPPRAVIEPKFGFIWNLFVVSVPKSSQTTAKKEEKRAKVEQEALSKYRRELDSQLDTFLHDTVKGLRAETSEICSHLISRIAKGEIITENSLKRLREWVDRFSLLNFVGDVTIESELQKLRASLPDAKTLRDNGNMAGQLSEALSTLKKEADSISDVSAITGQYKRRLIL